MKLSRFAALTSAFFVTSALALTGASAAASAQLSTATGYVALGDSYSSGVGAGSYDSASGSCKRSAKSYPALWAAAHSPPRSASPPVPAPERVMFSAVSSGRSAAPRGW